LTDAEGASKLNEPVDDETVTPVAPFTYDLRLDASVTSPLVDDSVSGPLAALT